MWREPRAPSPPPARMVSDPNVEPIKHHDPVPDLHEVFHEPGGSVAARVHLGHGTKLAVGAEDEVAPRSLEARFASRTVIERKDHVRFVLLLPFIIHAGQYSEEEGRNGHDLFAR